MNMQQFRGFTERKRFTDLDIGELFVFTIGQSVYIKISNNQFAYPIPFGTPPRQNKSVDVAGIGPRFYQNVFGIVGNPEVAGPPQQDFPTTFYSSTEPDAGVFPGADPILGFPYTPDQYQLFIDALTFDQFTNASVPAHLHWTLPSLTLLAVQIPHLTPYMWRIYFAVPNDITQSCSIDIPRTQAFRYIYPINYMWAAPWIGNVAPARPVGSGYAVPGGDTFNGIANIHPDSSIVFDARPPDTIDHFRLERGMDSLSNPTIISDAISSATTTYDDSSGRDPAHNYFYRLSGILTNDTTHPIPFNDVGLIRPYTLSVVRANGTNTITWDAPDPSQWPVTPADITVSFPPFVFPATTTCPSPP